MVLSTFTFELLIERQTRSNTDHGCNTQRRWFMDVAPHQKHTRLRQDSDMHATRNRKDNEPKDKDWAPCVYFHFQKSKSKTSHSIVAAKVSIRNGLLWKFAIQVFSLAKAFVLKCEHDGKSTAPCCNCIYATSPFQTQKTQKTKEKQRKQSTSTPYSLSAANISPTCHAWMPSLKGCCGCGCNHEGERGLAGIWSSVQWVRHSLSSQSIIYHLWEGSSWSPGTGLPVGPPFQCSAVMLFNCKHNNI